MTIQKIINKIKDGLDQNKKRMEKSLTEEVQENLKHENDGRGVDIDRAFGGIEIVNKIAGIIIENQELLQEDISFTADYNIQRFLEDKENLNNLKLREIHNPCCLFNRMDNFLKYLSEIEHSTLKELIGGIEQEQKNLSSSYAFSLLLYERECAIKEERRKLESKTGFYKTNPNACDIEVLKEEKRKIRKKGLFDDEIKREDRLAKIERFVYCPDERMKILKDQLNIINEKLEELEGKKFVMEELEGKINKEKKELGKVSKILDLKQYIESINWKTREYSDLRALLLKLNSSSLQYLERHYKFKKYLSDPNLLDKCTFQDWMNIYYADC